MADMTSPQSDAKTWEWPPAGWLQYSAQTPPLLKVHISSLFQRWFVSFISWCLMVVSTAQGVCTVCDGPKDAFSVWSSSTSEVHSNSPRSNSRPAEKHLVWGHLPPTFLQIEWALVWERFVWMPPPIQTSEKFIRSFVEDDQEDAASDDAPKVWWCLLIVCLLLVCSSVCF